VNVLRLATFNVRRCLGVDSMTDLERTAQAIRLTGAAVVALQELDRGMPRSGGVDQPAALAELTDMKVFFWPTLQRKQGEYGIGLAVRDDAEVDFRALPRVGGEEPRGAIIGRAGGLGIVATHVATHDPARAGHLDALGSLVGEMDAPVVIVGDLNSSRRGLAGLRAAGFDAGPIVPTIGRRRRRQIDYILAGPGARLVRSWTVRSDASDHLPLVAEIAVDRPAPEWQLATQ
jgi:endonuclease/exonuclease/phosphatase family metal-dependent hydrolase